MKKMNLLIFNKSSGIKSFMVPMISILLSGCMGMGSKFDCNVESGGKCAPMHHINQMASYGVFAERSYKSGELMLTKNKYSESKQQTYEVAPMRSSEKIQEIWLAPYEDSNGYYHNGSSIYAVVKKGKWLSL